MRVLFLVLLASLLTGCSTFNATVDGAQHVVNETIKATGEGVAGITEAVGEDVTDTITYGANGVADGIRKVSGNE
jgi:hypothetical protein